MYHLDDTIAAIATAPGGAVRGMVRLSGPAVLECLSRSFRPASPVSLDEVARPEAIAGDVRLPGMATPLPCDLYLWPGTRSYTRQPVAELHTIGSPPLLEALLRTLCAAGARVAESGEFTLRAFLAGRLDLVEAEAVLGVIDAVGPSQLTAALAQLAGGISRPLEDLRDQLLDLLAHVEAGLDFAEEDIEFVTPGELDRQLDQAEQSIAALVEQMTARAEVAGSVRAALVGWPNVGKSSLFNALVGRQGAIVAHQPGTTRDYLTAALDLDGVACELVDTAGAEPEGPADHIAQAAQEMTAEQHRQANLLIFCLDASRPLNAWERNELEREAREGETREGEAREGEAPAEPKTRSRRPAQQELRPPKIAQHLVVWTKCDISTPDHISGIETSSHTGRGIDRLRNAIRETAIQSQSGDMCVVAGTAARCRDSLREAGESLARARDVVTARAGEELLAAELRAALDELGKVVGAVYTDDVLDRIFSRFCIGK